MYKWVIYMTIAAIATANATGGIGIVRLSGERSVEIADKLFFGKSPKTMESHKMHLGKIKYNDKVIDEGLVCVFKGPNSYTGEDVVEFHCHGGIAVCKIVLEACISLGATLAPAGEFTKRAFLNGKMDLSQAEAVIDLINANTEKQVSVAAAQLDKNLSSGISVIRQSLVDALGHLMATMDFSEDGVEPMEYDEITESLNNAKTQIETLVKSSEDGRIIKDGVNTAIIGAPNAGKSSLLNAITGEDRAIVTDIKGTTRDVLETSVNIRGVRMNLFDTAGIRESDDTIEKIGIERSKKAVESADLVFFVVDGSKGITDEEQEILKIIDKSKTILIINKEDLDLVEIDKDGYLDCVFVSAKTLSGFEKLYDIIVSRYSDIEIKDRVVVTNPRHRESLVKTQSLVSGIINDIGGGMPFDIILSDMELAIATLGEIDGQTVSEEIVDNIFSNFCVGK